MADVSVEFGAKDTGLEKTLKTVQDELSRLNAQVKTGELSFDELQKTMNQVASAKKLETQIQGIGNATQAAGEKSEKMGEQSTMGFGKLAAAVGVGQLAAKAFTAALDAAFSAVRGTIQGFTDALDLGGRLSDLSASTGETAGKLLILERAFDNTGLGADKVGSAIAKMQKNIVDAREGSGEASKAFAKMGVSVQELEGKLPTEQFAILSSGINSIEDPTERAAAAMGTFGTKIGKDMIPLLSNFEGELADARDTVGSMAEIMDRRNAVFDAVGDRFKTISEKVRDFAAGILDRALPAIDAITSALSRIDAAKIGQDLADAFLGGENAMKGFQSAVDAIEIGELGLAFKQFSASTSLQMQQTGNSIINIFSATFATVSDIISQIFRADGPALLTITSAFDAVAGKLKSSIAGGLTDTIRSLGPAFTSIADGLEQSAAAGATQAELALQRIPVAAGLAAEDIGAALGGSVDLFKKNLGEANTQFFDTSAAAQQVADIEEEVSARVSETNAERAKAAEQLKKEKEERDKIRAAAEAAAAAESANAIELIKLETALNAAKAAGNEELVKSLEASKQDLESKKEIAKLTEEYKTKLGINADEAARLATNFVNAKNAISGYASWVDYIEGKKPEEVPKKLSQKTREARLEIEAYGKYIGEDLKRVSFPDIAKKLGIKTMGTTGAEQIDEILSYVKDKLPKSKYSVVDEAASKKAVEATAGEVKKTLSQAVDYSINTGEGGKTLLAIEALVGTIRGYVDEIRSKLPIQALA